MIVRIKVRVKGCIRAREMFRVRVRAGVRAKLYLDSSRFDGEAPGVDIPSCEVGLGLGLGLWLW